MKIRVATLAALGLSLAAAGLSGPAVAQPPQPKPKQDCFFLSQWRGWSSPDPSTIYLGVNFKQVYRLDLSGPSSELGWPDAHLINVAHAVSTVCSPLDLDLRVAQGGRGMSQPLFIKSMRKLTPAEVAAIPKKYLPQ